MKDVDLYFILGTMSWIFYKQCTFWVLPLLVIQLCLAWNYKSCCVHLDAPEQLLSCINNSVLSVAEAATRDQGIIFATFVSENINTYASNNLLFNMGYFQIKNYSVRILSTHTGDDYYPADRRWNKIKAVPNALLQWAKNSSYLVFIDADLVILDPEFDAMNVISAYPSANLIVASDAIDTANTGFMIVRNCPWSIDFFNRWWAGREMTDSFCDQHVLNKLLKNATDRNFVGITHPKAINSQWPAIDNFNEYDCILHLMGETDEIRNAVSRNLAERVCRVDPMASSSKSPYNRVHLTRKQLIEIRSHSVQAAWNLSVVQCSIADALEHDFNQLDRIISHECSRVKRIPLADSNNEYQLCQKMLLEAIDIHLKHLTHIARRTGSADGVEGSVGERRVLHLTRLLMLRFNIFELIITRTAESDRENVAFENVVINAAFQVLKQIETLQSALDMQFAYNVAFTRHKRGMVFGLLSEYYQRTRQWDTALEQEMVCITELAGALEHTTQEQLEFAGFVLAYVRSAARLAEVFRRKARLSEAEEWANIALNNANLLYASGINEERQRIAELKSIHALRQRVYEDLQKVVVQESAHASAI